VTFLLVISGTAEKNPKDKEKGAHGLNAQGKEAEGQEDTIMAGRTITRAGSEAVCRRVSK